MWYTAVSARVARAQPLAHPFMALSVPTSRV
jgi:hypothetical protein